MRESLRGYGFTLAAVWVAFCIAAFFYTRLYNIPARVAVAVLPALLVEVAFYLAAGMEPVRKRLEALAAPPILAVLMTASAVLPYCIAAAGTGSFQLRSLLTLLGLAGTASFWYLFAGKRTLADVGFLALMAAVYLSKIFNTIYITPAPKVTLSILGAAMWIRIGMMACLSIRKMGGIHFGFVPQGKEWRIGVIHYFGFLPFGYFAGTYFGLLHPQTVTPASKAVLLVVATFLGTLWVLAAMEEFFFRGVLQQLIRRETNDDFSAIMITAVIFGLAHLSYARAFPNWKMAVMAGIHGIVLGHAFLQAGSVRAPMVTHALVVTTWKVFLD
ncbi:MAG: CPBP family intramembrane glutamic endopeptidase [Bryobacteraceae bacterium]